MKQVKGQVDIKDLTWEDKEKILRVLFARMNGVSLSNESERRKKAQEELSKASTHRVSFKPVLAQDRFATSPTPKEVSHPQPDQSIAI